MDVNFDNYLLMQITGIFQKQFCKKLFCCLNTIDTFVPQNSQGSGPSEKDVDVFILELSSRNKFLNSHDL